MSRNSHLTLQFVQREPDGPRTAHGGGGALGVACCAPSSPREPSWGTGRPRRPLAFPLLRSECSPGEGWHVLNLHRILFSRLGVSVLPRGPRAGPQPLRPRAPGEAPGAEGGPGEDGNPDPAPQPAGTRGRGQGCPGLSRGRGRWACVPFLPRGRSQQRDPPSSLFSLVLYFPPSRLPGLSQEELSPRRPCAHRAPYTH